MADPVFDERVVDASHNFRTIMSAMSRPGKIHPFLPSTVPPDPLFPGTGAILLTLCDFQTPIYLVPELATSAVSDYLRFHTGAPLTSHSGASSFAVLVAGHGMPRPADFARGTHEYPDRSTTLIIQVAEILDGGHITLSGPGVESAVDLAVSGIDDSFWRNLMDNHDGFPVGVDVVFVSPAAICSCPRSTTIRLRESV